MRVHFQGALKQSPLEPDDTIIENKNLQYYHRSLPLLCNMFYFTLFVKDVVQNSWRTNARINSAPEIRFRGALKKDLNVPEDRPY